MTSGDVVNGISPLATTITFQPAATTEYAITSIGSHLRWVNVTDGALVGRIYESNVNQDAVGANVKIMINNTIYIQVDTTPGQSGYYTGIQLK